MGRTKVAHLAMKFSYALVNFKLTGISVKFNPPSSAQAQFL